MTYDFSVCGTIYSRPLHVYSMQYTSMQCTVYNIQVYSTDTQVYSAQVNHYCTIIQNCNCCFVIQYNEYIKDKGNIAK